MHEDVEGELVPGRLQDRITSYNVCYTKLLRPIIVVACFVGSYVMRNLMFDVWCTLIFGVLGYIMKKLKYPLAPLAVALVLGDMTERFLRQSLILSDGSFGIFFTRPIAAVCSVFAISLFLSYNFV